MHVPLFVCPQIVVLAQVVHRSHSVVEMLCMPFAGEQLVLGGLPFDNGGSRGIISGCQDTLECLLLQ